MLEWPGHASPRLRHVQAAEEDEHLILGGDATAERACIAATVAGTGGAIAGTVARGLAAPAARAAGLACGAGGFHYPTRPADAADLKRRIGRGGAELYIVRIAIAVVVERAEGHRALVGGAAENGGLL